MVGGIVSSAIVVDSWPRREGSPRRRPVVETDQCVLDHAVAVVRRVRDASDAVSREFWFWPTNWFCASALDCCRMLMDPPKVGHGRGV